MPCKENRNMLIKRPINICVLFAFSNIYLFFSMLKSYSILSFLLVTVCVAHFILFNIMPRFKKGYFTRPEVLMSGRELIIDAFILFVADVCFYIFFLQRLEVKAVTIVFCVISSLIVLFIVMMNGILRILFASKQLSLVMRLALIFGWWIPAANIIICWRCCHVARNERRFLLYKRELNESRKENDICKTKYPLVLVHGIFWRDWQLFNYWGRITGELTRNGAVIYYGNQQSAAPMEVGAMELKNQILEVVAREKCEKVNIIAHSKGGLDARYAISCMGAAPYVASLTAIGTPHRGCAILDLVFKRLPDSIIRRISKGYSSMYKKLGDTEPDFRSGIYDLTTEKCERFNEVAVDRENVLYQSAASKMNSFFSADFPLNVGYSILRRKEGENDGFVSVESSKWGNYLGFFETKRRRGVSHGDMIDLTRKNIKGFDVCECYVDIVKGLKEKGL